MSDENDKAQPDDSNQPKRPGPRRRPPPAKKARPGTRPPFGRGPLPPPRKKGIPNMPQRPPMRGTHPKGPNLRKGPHPPGKRPAPGTPPPMGSRPPMSRGKPPLIGRGRPLPLRGKRPPPHLQRKKKPPLRKLSPEGKSIEPPQIADEQPSEKKASQTTTTSRAPAGYTENFNVKTHTAKLPKPVRYAILLIMLPICIIASVSIGNWLYQGFWQEEKDQIDASSADTLIAQFVEANGGLDYLKSISSISFRGQMVQGTGKYKFVQIKKMPQNSWLKMELPSYNLILAFAENQPVWKKFEFRANKNYHVEELKREEAEALRNKFIFFNPIISYALAEKTGATLQGTTLIGSQATYKIQLPVEAEKPQILVYLDQENLQLLRMDKVSADGSVLKTIFRDYKLVDKVFLPYHTEVHPSKKGLEVQNFFIKKAAINPGVISSLFTIPPPPPKDE